MSTQAQVQEILVEVLQLPGETQFTDDMALLGSIPEFDSMAVVTVLTACEEMFGFEVADDEISADVFMTFGSLCGFVEQKL